MSKKGLVILFIAAVFTGCGEYQKLLKSKDPELKYEKAIEYFDRKEFVKAQQLFEDVSVYYKGTERSEDVLNYLSRCYMGHKDYASACEYYEAYIRNYPKGRYIIEARYMVGYCSYMDSPDPKLDQTTTYKAIDYLNNFVELYPESPYANDAYTYLEELYNKLAQKEFISARLYYNLGTYLGNNYESCVIVSQNALKKFPGNKFQEDFGWLILQSKYQLVKLSVADRRQERAEDAIDECYNFLVEYPETKHRKAVEKMRTELGKIAK